MNTAILGILAAVAAGADAPGHWPQFHGPRRDNMSTETHLLKRWPPGGPKLLRTIDGCGGGYSAVAIDRGRIVLVGDFGEREAVFAMDGEGKVLWRTANGKSWKRAYPGARTTPTIDGDRIYHMGPHGRLACLAFDDGRELWAVDLARKYHIRPRTWGFSENVLVDGNAVFAAPGGARGRIVALDKRSGKEIWANTDLRDGPGYCSPLMVPHQTGRQLVTVLAAHVVAVDPQTGKTLWTHRHAAPAGQNVTMPLYHDGCVYVASGHRTGGRVLRLAEDGRGVRELWHTEKQDNCHGGVLLLDGALIGSGCRLYKRGLVCLDYETGTMHWNRPDFAKSSLTWAEGLVYAVDNRGRVRLLDVGPGKCDVAGEFRLPKAKGELLSHPVVCGGRLYIRWWDKLHVFDVRAGVPAE